jgi:hypothetical protein
MTNINRINLEFAQSMADLEDEAYAENTRRDQEQNLRDAVEGYLKEYVQESVHEGAPMTANDFAVYLEFVTTPEHLKD